MKRNVQAIDGETTKANWQTPPRVFQKLSQDFGPFDLDLTADRDRALCVDWLGPGHIFDDHRDALAIDWTWIKCGTACGQRARSGYSNPPYGSFVPLILKKARKEAERGFSTTLLLPMRVTIAFRKFVLNRDSGAAELLFVSGRIVFFEDGKPRWNVEKLKEGKYVPDPAMFDSIIVRYTPGCPPLSVGEWTLPEEHWLPL